MTKISLFLVTLIAAAVPVFDRPAMARLTPEDENSVPPDIFKAYKDVGQHRIYVCPRTALQNADRRFVDLREKIRLRYRLDFDSFQEDEQIVIPTHCPSPKSFPDFGKRVKAYGIAIGRLEEALDRHPSLVNEALAQEDAATRFLVLEVLNRIEARRAVPICINGELLRVDTQDQAKLKEETVEVLVGPEYKDYRAKLRSLFFRKRHPAISSRKFDPTSLIWQKLRVRPATLEECSRHLTYRIRRPIIRGDRAILSGINVRSGGSTEFAVVAEKSDGEWALRSYRPYGGYSEGRPINILQGIPPGEVNDPFYLLE